MNKILAIVFSLLCISDAHAVYKSSGNVSNGGDVSNSVATATGGNTSRTLADHFADVYNAADYGVKCDGQSLADVTATNSSAVISSPSYQFSSADVGKTIVVTNGSVTQGVSTTILSVAGGNATLTSGWGSNTTITDNTGRATFYTTDNTTAINNALTAIVNTHKDNLGHNLTGFKFTFPNGICATGPITIPRLSMLTCAGGPHACALFLKSGSNADFVKSENFATLTGTGLNYGPTGTYNGIVSSPNVPSWFGIQDMHLDGNKFGQSSGRCITFYGNAQKFLGHNMIENCFSDNIYTEACDGFSYDATDWKSEEEGRMDHVISRNSGRYGWLDRGPHDSTLLDFIGPENASTAFRSETLTGKYAGSVHAGKIHPYTSGDGTGIYLGSQATIEEAYIDFDNIEIAAPSVSITKIFSTACGYLNLDCIIIDATALGTTLGYTDIEFYSSAANVNGLHIQPGGGQNDIGPVIGSAITPVGPATLIKNESPFVNLHDLNLHGVTSANSTCLYLGGSYVNVSGNMFSCYNFVDVTADGGGSIVDLTMFKAGGTNYIAGGIFNPTDYVRVWHDDGTVVSQSPGLFRTYGLASNGTKFTTTGCSVSATTGGATAGTYTSGTTGACTVVITMAGATGLAAPTGWSCAANDRTTPADKQQTTASSTTTATVSGTTVSGDVVDFHCIGY